MMLLMSNISLKHKFDSKLTASSVHMCLHIALQRTFIIYIAQFF